MRIARNVLAAVFCLANLAAHAQITNDVIKIGVLTDFSSVYSDYSGQNSMVAIRLAVEDMGGQIDGKKIEIISADFQNKADVSLAIARKWIDEDKVDVIVDAPNSGVAAALQTLAREKNKVFLIGAVSSDLTGKFCSPNGVHFQADTYSMAAVAGRALVQKGLKTWYSVTADYAMGHAMERDTFGVVTAGGGAAAGSVRHPFGATDMSSFVMQAQNSKAQVLSIASAGGDLQNILRSASEFGVNKSMQVVALNVELLDAFKLGKKLLGGTYFTESWYWDQNDKNRAWTKRFVDLHPKKFHPSRSQVGLYAATQHYLRAVKELKSDGDGKAIVDKMKALPVDNIYASNGKIREDGRLIKEMYLAQIKTPDESKGGDWDLYKIVATVPGDKAFRPVAESECPLVKK